MVPLDLGCPSSRKALLGPAGAAYTRSGIVVATDGSRKKSGVMGAAVVAKEGRMQALGMQRRDLPLSLYRHSVRQLLLHVIKLTNKRAVAGRRTRFIKVRAHRGGGT